MSIQSLEMKLSRGLRRAGLLLAVGAACAVPTMVQAAGAGDGLAQALAQTQAAMQKIQLQTQGALGTVLGQSGGSLGAVAQQSFGNLALVLRQASPGYVKQTAGTTSVSGTITWQNQARSYLLIRPQTANPGAPALLLLHAHGMTSSGMANLTVAGRLAADYGVYVYLPQGKGNKWNEDPASSDTTDDVGFLSALVDHAVAVDGVDRTHVYAAGYSGGGFMAERLACQGSSKIAGFVAVAATLRDSLMSLCTPVHGMAVAFIDGTSDAIVPYKGEPTLQSAAGSAAFWAGKDNCPATQMSTTTLPQKVNDGTTVALTSFNACPAESAVSLYTVNGGGHTWPGSPDGAYTAFLGKTSQNLDATIALWQYLIPYSLP